MGEWIIVAAGLGPLVVGGPLVVAILSIDRWRRGRV